MQEINLEEQNLTPIKSTVKKPTFSLLAVLLVVALILGSGAGIIIGKSKLDTSATPSATSSTDTLPDDSSQIKVGKVYGSSDEASFPDKAEGVVVAGGVSGEGSHHLVRVGGVSQNVYLSSSVVDLDTVLGARVQVWGQTMGAKKAGWLIDVGRLKVVELNATLPE